jgi:hypothetical protein
MFISEPLLAGTLFCGVAGIIHGVIVRYEEVLDARIAATDKKAVWRVAINDTYLGEISDAEYARIRKSVFFGDTAWLWRQIVILAGFIWRTVFYGLPIVIFWLVGGCFLFFPEIFTSLRDFFVEATGDQIIVAMQRLLLALASCMALVAGWRVFTGGISIANAFELECNWRIARNFSIKMSDALVIKSVSVYRFDDVPASAHIPV